MDDVYALATPKRSFSMLFNTANVPRRPGEPRKPGGSLSVMAVGRASVGRPRRRGREGRFRQTCRTCTELHDIIRETTSGGSEIRRTRVRAAAASNPR